MAKRSQQQQKLAYEKRKVFARNLRKARTDAEITQEDLEKRTGLTQQFISYLENGKTSCSLDNAAVLADAVNVPLCKLLSTEYTGT